jgi:predicted nucleic acid-binding protein
VIVDSVLIDAGPLVALLHASDSRHDECRRQAAELHGPTYTTWAVVAEAAWILRRLPNSLERLLAAIDDNDIQVVHVAQGALVWLKDKARQYYDLSPQIADLTLLYSAEQLQIAHIFTLDRRDFAVYRDSAGKPFRLLPDLT